MSKKLWVYDKERDTFREPILWEICEYWISIYSKDIFITKPPLIVKIRELMEKVLEKKKL